MSADHEEKEEFEAKKADALREADENAGDDNHNRRKGDTKVSLTLRILVAAYVLYLAYGLIQDFEKNTGNNRIFIAAAIGVFLIAGGGILILSVKKLIRKEYVDANEDAEDKER